MKNYGENLFKGSAIYYSKYRPLYPASLVRFLVNRISLDGNGRMLDLGCGTGQLALRFSDWFEQIVGIDTEPEMIDEAKRLSNERRVKNMEWFIGDINSYKGKYENSFRFVTIAKAFHWMNRDEVLEQLYDMVSLGGGVAIIDQYSPNKKVLPWQKKVSEVVKHWYGEERRAGNTTYSHPTISHQAVIENSKFDLEVHQIPTFEQTWTIDSIIGNIYSTSYGSKRFLGDYVHLFEENVREELLALNNTGIFKESIETSVKLAIKSK
ncbi:class I SAM-dependent methyltransferase [Rummeliibacillus pycnus]|uniref:class I SAM-dependent methyltransferase n=1 Tax=Rummeliibacillus pycnus TaxID=101070 RepID=UPI000C9B044B|nr:methyltransferase domain-containing protein [Rummeliibacillus pycnus]